MEHAIRSDLQRLVSPFMTGPVMRKKGRRYREGGGRSGAERGRRVRPLRAVPPSVGAATV